MERRPVAGYEGLYEVDTSGRVWSLPRLDRMGRPKGGHQRKPFVRGDGYSAVTLSLRGKKSTFTIHRLVLETFVGPRPEGGVARHLDGDPGNNDVGNLKWGTQSENMADAERHGTVARGMRLPQSKLTKHHVLAIRTAPPSMTITELADAFGVSWACVQKVQQRRSWAWVK